MSPGVETACLGSLNILDSKAVVVLLGDRFGMDLLRVCSTDGPVGAVQQPILSVSPLILRLQRISVSS